MRETMHGRNIFQVAIHLPAQIRCPARLTAAKRMLYDLLFDPPILLYQMPKTGSQTIEATLQQHLSTRRLLRFHFLSPTIAATIRKGLRYDHANAAWRKEARAQLRLMRRVRFGLLVRKVVQGCGVRLPKLEVITAVREPIAVALSSMFENYFHAFPTGPAALAACREAFLKPKTVKYIQEWFDLELKSMLGLDVYKQPFHHEQGYAIYETTTVRALVYRFAALPKLPAMLEDFLGKSISHIAERNRGTQKNYSEPYQYVQAHLRLTGDFLAAQYRSKMMVHFYSTLEREQFYRRWVESNTTISTTPALGI